MEGPLPTPEEMFKEPTAPELVPSVVSTPTPLTLYVLPIRVAFVAAASTVSCTELCRR